jgi:hypothetical protein
MKVIQLFNPAPLPSNAEVNKPVADFEVLSSALRTALGFLKLQEFHSQIELYTTQEGKELLIDGLGLKYEKVVLIPKLSDHSFVDRCLQPYYCAAQQTSPFVLLTGKVLFNEALTAHQKESECFVCYREVNRAYTSFNEEAVSGIADLAHHGRHFTSSINQDILGGSPDIWKGYYSWIGTALANEKKIKNLSFNSIQFLLGTCLFSEYAEQNNVAVTELFKDNLRTHNLGIAQTSRPWYNQKGPYLKIPDRLLSYRDTFYALLLKIRQCSSSTYLAAIRLRDSRWSPAPEQLSKEHFPLTIFFYFKYLNTSGAIDNGKYTIKYIDQLLSRVPDTHEFKPMVKDIFYYELNKYKLNKRIQKDLTYGDSYSQSKQAGGNKAFVYTTSKYATILNHKWKWGNSLGLEKINELKMFYNSTIPPSTIYTSFYYNSILHRIDEMPSNQLDFIISKTFQKEKSKHEAIEEILTKFSTEEQQSNAIEIKAVIRERIDILINQRMLVGKETYE